MFRHWFAKMVCLLCCLWIVAAIPAYAQTKPGAGSIYEEERILSVQYDYRNLPVDNDLAMQYRQQVEDSFQVYPYSHFSWIQVNYSLTQIKNLPIVDNVDLDIETLPEAGLNLIVKVVQ